MDRKPLLTVIVPVYKVEAYLAKCVESILAQTYENLEVILVDDGSPDNCGRICDEFAARDSRVRVIHKENGGLSSARNAGLDIVKGEYIGFVDSDDWIEPEMYSHMLTLAEKYGVKLVCAGRYDVWEDREERTVGLCPQKEEVLTGQELAGRIFTWDGLDSAAWDKLYHRSLLETVRYPYGRICEDVPVTYKIALEAGQVAMCDRPFYNYLHRAGSITQQTKVTEKSFHSIQHTQEVYAFIREHCPELEPQAAYLRVKSLYYLLRTLDQADAESRARFAKECREARKALGSFAGFFLRDKRFGGRERFTNLLLSWDLYRLMRPVFRK